MARNGVRVRRQEEIIYFDLFPVRLKTNRKEKIRIFKFFHQMKKLVDWEKRLAVKSKNLGNGKSDWADRNGDRQSPFYAIDHNVKKRLEKNFFLSKKRGVPLTNPSFESSPSNATGWVVWCSSTCSGYVGSISSTGCYSGRCFKSQCYASSGIEFIGQSFSAIVGMRYSISFRLNLGGSGNTAANRLFSIFTDADLNLKNKTSRCICKYFWKNLYRFQFAQYQAMKLFNVHLFLFPSRLQWNLS